MVYAREFCSLQIPTSSSMMWDQSLRVRVDLVAYNTYRVRAARPSQGAPGAGIPMHGGHRGQPLSARRHMPPAAVTRANNLWRSKDFHTRASEDFRGSIEQQAEHDKAPQQSLAAPAQPPRVPKVKRDGIIISGMEESETETKLQERVSDIIHNIMQLQDVTVISVVRLGKQPTADGGPRKLWVKLGSEKEAMHVDRKSTRRLSQLNIERESNGEIPIQINRNLSPWEAARLHRYLLWVAFEAAKAEGKECHWEPGYRLYIDGSEVLPDSSA